MKKALLPVLLFLFITSMPGAGNYTTEGGNVTEINLTSNATTEYWAGIVGWMQNNSANPAFPISYEDVGGVDIYTNYPNGTFRGISMVVTRLPSKPNLSDIYSPVLADFDTGGMFSNFSVFAGLNFSLFIDSPFYTFLPALTMNCTLGTTILPCPYITLLPNVSMAVLKFSNGTNEEPLFITIIQNQPGFNGSYFDFEYMVPINETYYFYVYPGDCNITVWIDGTQTTAFPKTGVPYDVQFLVTYIGSASPIQGATLRVIEENGRSILYPNLYPGRIYSAQGFMTTNSSGNAVFALSPTRYNLPDSYGYIAYVEVLSPVYCRQNLSIAMYNALDPTYRTSLVDAAYGSQVKSSVQNMNSLASTATRWIYARKMRNASVTVNTTGEVSALPTLKAGAPNYLNITVLDAGTPVAANLSIQETDGHIIFVPAQPDKDLYNNTGPFYSNETFILIPTRYNNNANLTLFVYYNDSNVANLTFTVDSVLEPPSSSEMDMDDYTNALIGSALQNINLVLSNIGKSISTV
ncbi:MAG: hypothetical protein AB1657_00020 [Candidatus Micrarchaeota archaeon]